MPSGKTHDKIAIISIIPIFIIGNMYLSLDNTIILSVSSLFTQLMFGPDLDSKSCHYKRWGFFRWLWLPYRKLIKHRSRLSHGLLFSPIIRSLYFITSFIILMWLSNKVLLHYTGINLLTILNFELIKGSISQNISIIMMFIAGIYTGTAIHTLTDKISSFFDNLI